MGKFLGIVRIIKSTPKLSEEDIKSRAFLQAEVGIHRMDLPREDAQVHDISISLTGTVYVIANSRKNKGKVLKENILKDIVQRGFDARIEGIQKKNRQAIDEKDAAIALLNDDLENRDNQMQAIQYEDVGLQGEIRAKNQQIATLQRRYVGYLTDEDKNNGISIIAKNNEEAEHPYISICDNMVIEGTRLGCCWHVIKVAHYLLMEIH